MVGEVEEEKAGRGTLKGWKSGEIYWTMLITFGNDKKQ